MGCLKGELVVVAGGLTMSFKLPLSHIYLFVAVCSPLENVVLLIRGDGSDLLHNYVSLWDFV